MSWWGLLSIFGTVFASPFAGALEPPTLPLPQTIDYATYMRAQLLHADFSTDPRAARPQVAAAVFPLEAFIINYEPCAALDDSVAYRLVVRNLSDAPVDGVVAQFIYPAALEFKEARVWPGGAGVPGGGGIVEWNIGTILPGPENWHELNLSFVVVAPAGGLLTELRVSGGGALVITSHGIPGNCPANVSQQSTPLPAKQPAIICDPGEIGCAGSVPILGRLFGEVTRDPARRPTICSPLDPDGCIANLPQLGPRFAEAVASLLPGECSVLEDAVLAAPAFQDGLLRLGDVAALFMRPLYDSGQDFSRLVLANELLGINNKLHAKERLRAIHTKHWQIRREALQSVLEGTLSTDTIRGRINQWHLGWVNETRAEQADLARRYDQLQTQREKKFDPIAEQAIRNAQTSIERACGAPLFPPRDPDAGLRRRLFDPPGSVKQQYVQTLQQRGRDYQTTQRLFVDANNAIFPEAIRAATWQRELRAALDAFDAGDKEPLARFVADIHGKDQRGFAGLWEFSYQQHAQADVRDDEAVRLSWWEPALDLPKTVAAACARDATLAARVEVSWCESGIYPANFVLPLAQGLPSARDAAPPAPILGGELALINPQRVVGVSCRGLPGDPFWADDCSCNCNQLVPRRDGNILFCQAAAPQQENQAGEPGDGGGRQGNRGGGAQGNGGRPVGDQNPPAENAGEPGENQQPIKPIIRHDIYAIALAPRTQDECLQEAQFDDHFLVNYP